MKTTIPAAVIDAFPPTTYHLYQSPGSTGRYTYATARKLHNAAYLPNFAEDNPVDNFFLCECKSCQKISAATCPVVILVEGDGTYMVVLWENGTYEMVGY